MTWVVGRLWTRFGQRMLALLLERRFPQLGDRLITAIELKDAPRAHDSPLADVMWQRTAAQAADALKAVDLNDVFNPRPLKRALIVAGVMLASITVMEPRTPPACSAGSTRFSWAGRITGNHSAAAKCQCS